MTDADNMRELILSGCLPERRQEAAALLDRYPPRLADLPPDRAGEGGEDGVVLDPRKIGCAASAARIYAHEVAHCADADAGRDVRHDLNFAARAEGLTRRLTGSGSADRAYNLHESGLSYDEHVHSIIESRAARIATAERYDPALDAACDRLDTQLAGLRGLALVGVPAAAGLTLFWVPGLWDWLQAWGPMLGFLALVVFIPWMLLRN